MKPVALSALALVVVIANPASAQEPAAPAPPGMSPPPAPADAPQEPPPPADAPPPERPAQPDSPLGPAPTDSHPQGAPPAAAPGATVPKAEGEADDASLLSDLNATMSERIVTGASRAAETGSEAPATTSTVQGDDLYRFGIRTVSEALQYLAMGVFVVPAQGFEAATLGARGVAVNDDSNDHFLIVVDNTPVNEPRAGTARTGWVMGLPIEMIETIEVILGPGSVLYGGNAMFGVINIKTKAARHMRGLHVMGEFGVSPSQNANNGIKSFDPATGLGTSPRFAASLGHEFKLFGQNAELTGEFEWARATLPTSDTAQQQDVSVLGNRVTWGGTPAGGIVHDEVLGGYSRLRVGRLSLDAQLAYHRNYAVENNAFVPSSNRIEGLLARLDATYNVDLSEHVSGFARMYLGRDDANPRIVQPAFGPQCAPLTGTGTSQCETHGVQTGQWQGLELQATYDPLRNNAFPLMVGVDVRARQAGIGSVPYELATGEPLGTTGGMQSRGLTASGYVQQRARFTSWLTVNAGVRYDFVKDWGMGFPKAPTGNPVSLATLPSVSNDAVSPRVAILLHPTDTTTFHIMGGLAFRAPAPIEEFFSLGSFFRLPDHLRPEHVKTVEAGVRQRFGTHRALLSFFASEYDDLISTAVIAQALTYQNINTIKNYGFNLGVDGSAVESQLSYGASFTLASSALEAATNPAAVAPPLQGILNANLGTAAATTPPVGAPEAAGNAHVAYDFRGELPTLALVASVMSTRATTLAYSNSIFLGNAIPGAPPVTSLGAYQWPSQVANRYLDASMSIRGTVSGPIPAASNWRYRLAADYVTAPWTPIGWGPSQAGYGPALANIRGQPGFNGGAPPAAQGYLFPLTRLTIFAGLEVKLDP